MSAELIIQASQCTLDPPERARGNHGKLKEIRDNLLPAEAAARADVESQIAALERWERAEAKGARLGLSILSPEIFAWKKNKLPAFAVYSIDGDGECVLSTDPAKEKVPAPCKAFYQNALGEALTERTEKFFSSQFTAIWCASAFIVEASYFYGVQASAAPTWGRFILGLTLGILASFCASLMVLIALVGAWTLLVRKKERTASARFTGTIPSIVREKIRRYASEFKEILIVAEANWTLFNSRSELRIPVSCDPLIVGWDGDFFWLIDRFDVSSIEQLASEEFAVKPDNLDSSVLDRG